MTAAEPWRPSNVAEQLMSDAARDGNPAVLMAVLGSAKLYLPGALPAGDDEPDLVTHDGDGRTFVFAFTSAEALTAFAAASGAPDTWLVLSLTELAEAWPGDGWRLAVNPYTPISVDLGPDELRQAAASVAATIGAAPGPEPAGFLPANPTERLLYRCLTSGDRGRLAAALLAAWVLVPTAPDGPGAPWHRLEVDGRSVLVAFTSAARMTEVAPRPGPFAPARLAELLRDWPAAFDALAVNPGSAVEVVVADDERDALVELARSAVTLADPPRPGVTLHDVVG